MTKNKPLVLIVEDQKINREILKGILNKDYRTLEAENGKVALQLLEKNDDISVILLDIVMPVMDGFTFLREIKEAGYDDIPVVAVTGSLEEGTEQEVLNLGARDFVTKPYQPMTLLTRLKNAIVNSQLFTLGSIFLASMENPAVIFRIKGDVVKAVVFNQRFMNDIVPEYQIDVSQFFYEDVCVTPEDAEKAKEIFFSINKKNSPITLDAKTKTPDGKIVPAQIQFIYGGASKNVKTVIVEIMK